MANSRRTYASDKAAGVLTVPAEALRLDAGPFTLAGKQAANGERPVSMLARTAEPIENWYWGKVVHDMAGMKLAAPTLPIDYCHDREQILGYLDQFKADDKGLNVSGKLVQFQPDDRVAEVCHKADAGVPYQSSIEFDESTYVLECVPEGYQVTVNGYQLQGPACVIREWTLVAVAVCPCGADMNTRTKLSTAGAADVPVRFVTPSKDQSTMSATATETKPAETKPEEKPAEQTTAETKPAETKPAESAPATGSETATAQTEFRAKLTKFSAAFGAVNGSQWAADGLTYEQALEKHSAALATQLTAEQTKTKELETKLGAVPRGEEKPVSFSTNEKHEAGTNVPTKLVGLGKMAKFAASLKLPGGK